MSLDPNHSHTFLVEAEEEGLRLDKFLTHKMQTFSRTRLSQLIGEGCVTTTNIPLKAASFKVKHGQIIEVILPQAIEASPTPQDIPLEILYEDKDIIVINKQPGMVVHPAPGNYTGTLVNALLNHCGESLSGINGIKRPGIVHRLDKETSGLLVAAKNDKAHHGLADQLLSREMGRIYQALLWGMLVPPQGTIEGGIGRDSRNRQKMAIRENGKFARTHYKVLKYFGNLISLVECRLDTGRTHQIRVHLTSKGHPLVGDPLYGRTPRAIPPYLKNFLLESWQKGRQCLHAKELSFIHPTTGEKLHFATELPEDMRNLINVLNSHP